METCKKKKIFPCLSSLPKFTTPQLYSLSSIFLSCLLFFSVVLLREGDVAREVVPNKLVPEYVLPVAGSPSLPMEKGAAPNLS